ncbi:hypothetical protein [uncultured Eubacterium sp.]|uniref:hypothetical protein n=1 Tax=Eubacterium sp. TaxID=142586 RepID=UPI002673BFC3|nr:hypothetical protein [uncultured Eubacterium sp.]
MRMLKGVIVTGMISLAMGMCVSGADNGVAINSTNFPEESLRKAVQVYDKNNDGYLSDDESKKITKLTISKYPDLDGLDDVDATGMKLYYEKDEFKFDFTGIDKLDYLENLQLSLINGRTKNNKHYASVAENIECLYNTKNLKKLGLYDVSFAKLDTGKIKKLENLYISSNPTLKTLKYNKNLTKLSLEGVKKFKNFNIPALKKLKSVQLLGNVKKIKFGTCPKLKTVTFDVSANSIDTSKLKNLKKVYFENGKIKNVNFTKNKKLEVFSTNWTKITGKVDLSKNNKLKEFSVDGKGVKNFVLSKKNRIEWFRWANAGLKELSLKELRLNPKHLETIVVWGNPKLKKVNIKGYKKVKTVNGAKAIK